MSAEDKDDALLRDYRRASADQAGRPGDATRRAILAEARAAAHRRRPAANDSRYVLRAVAGVAAIGVALLVWRQMDHRLPGTSPAGAEVVASAPPPELREAQVNNAAPAAPAAPPAPILADRVEKARNAADEARVDSIAQAAQATVTEPATAGSQLSAAAPAPAPAARPAAAPPTLQRADVQAAERASGNEPDLAQLLRQTFPRQFESDDPHRLWLVQDSAGNVLLSGELEAGQSLADLVPRLRRDLGDLPVSWRTENIVNARGRTIELSRASLP